MADKICYPDQETWFVIWNDSREKIISYGSINPEQCMNTKWTEIDYYDTNEAYVDVMLDNGINPFPEEEEVIEE